MYSAILCKEDFLETAKAVKGHSIRLFRVLNRCNKLMLEYKRECENYEVLENIGGLSLQLMNLLGEMETSWRKSMRKRYRRLCWNFLLKCVIF